MTGTDDEAQPAADGWRPVLAALANAEQRLLLAEVILDEERRRGTSIRGRRREKGLARLAAAGLLAADGTTADGPTADGSTADGTTADGSTSDGTEAAGGRQRWRIDTTGLRALLSAPAARDRPSSGDDVVDRFVRDGRIHTFPAKPGPRRRLLQWAAERALSPAEELSEAEATARLARLTADPATLRRYLVDAGWVTRSPDGSGYRLAAGGTDAADPAASPPEHPGSSGSDDGPAAAAARAAGLEVAVTRHGRVSSLAEAAAARGIEPRDLVKTLVIRRSGDDYVFVLVTGDRTFSWPKLRALLGTNRLSMPDAAEAQGVTGYERGTITPFGSARALPVYADREMAGRTISIGGGAQGVGLTVAADEALRVLHATVADLSDPPGA